MALLDEVRDAGFETADLIRTLRNGRTKNPLVLAAEVQARR